MDFPKPETLDLLELGETPKNFLNPNPNLKLKKWQWTYLRVAVANVVHSATAAVTSAASARSGTWPQAASLSLPHLHGAALVRAVGEVAVPLDPACPPLPPWDRQQACVRGRLRAPSSAARWSRVPAKAT